MKTFALTLTFLTALALADPASAHTRNEFLYDLGSFFNNDGWDHLHYWHENHHVYHRDYHRYWHWHRG